MTFSPNFKAYATAHGNTPEQQMAADTIEYPGGCMTGFLLWVSARKAEFKAAKPAAFLHGDICDLNAWVAFLSQCAVDRNTSSTKV